MSPAKSSSRPREPWERDFSFVIPVRDVPFWSRAEVRERLCDTLDFLSNDRYRFEFRPMPSRVPRQQYCDVSDNPDWPFYAAERVVMFSGGLDSLTGGGRTAAAGRHVVLVSHRPSPRRRAGSGSCSGTSGRPSSRSR